MKETIKTSRTAGYLEKIFRAINTDWFFWDTYYDFALASGMEQSYIDSYVRYYTSPGWLAFILLFTTLMGFLGCMVGSRLIRRHFQKAGVL